MELSAIVVVPARDEQDRIGQCLAALAAQTVGVERFAVVVVADACRDATEAVATQAGARLGLQLQTITGPGQGPGAARRLGMEIAAQRLLAAGRADGLIATTDADSTVRHDWLERQLAHVAAGAQAIAGLIELDPGGPEGLPATVMRRREVNAARRLASVRAGDPEAGHHHFAGASLAVTAATYQAVGGLQPAPALEDAAFARRLRAAGVTVRRPTDVRVRTSARSDGRVSHGLSVDLAVARWLDRNRLRATAFDPARLRLLKADTAITVIIPTKQCRETIAGVLNATVAPLQRAGLVDETVVVDAGSPDGTARVAQAAGVRVLQQDALRPEFGPALGKGDAMWRALSVTSGELVCFLDGDTADPDPQHLLGLIGPLLTQPELTLVKGAFERPLQRDGRIIPHEGGRVTELMARPLINLHEPRLAGFTQPLAGEFAARRTLLEAIPFPAGYGVEIGVLIDALRRDGLDALAECDLGQRQNRHQPLRALGEMAYAVLAAVERRSQSGEIAAGGYMRPWQDGQIVEVAIEERPPLAALRPAAARDREPRGVVANQPASAEPATGGAAGLR